MSLVGTNGAPGNPLKSVERLLPFMMRRPRHILAGAALRAGGGGGGGGGGGEAGVRMSGCQIALLMSFNSVLLKDGLRRFIP